MRKKVPFFLEMTNVNQPEQVQPVKPRANMSYESGYLIGKIEIGSIRKCDMKIE